MTNGSKQFFQFKRVVIHPRWRNPKQYSYDIGLIQLDRPAILNRYDTLQLHGVLFVKNERYEIINFTFTGLLYLKYAGDGAIRLSPPPTLLDFLLLMSTNNMQNYILIVSPLCMCW